MAASSSTCVNSNSTSNSSFDVFINHRGPDVKNTFASYLYRRLTSFGLKVFLDREELQQGEYFNSQIEGAIRTASVHVAIFSARYAESTWCLNELVTMLESQGTIIPVFYHVKPSELRWTKGKDGVYARDLQKLEEKTTDDPKKPRHDSATIEQWRKALSTVSEISGFELEAFNGDEGALLENVVEHVMKKVKRTPLNVAKYPTGLDEKVIDFENKVLSLHQHGERKPQVVGVVGLGGVGKTTLAKELFNRKSSRYKRSCFLDDVRENVGKGSLTMLQNKLLRSLTGSGLQVDNKYEGIEMIKNHLSSDHQILLVLDDVDTVDQVDALVPDRTCIHPNSLILITTRDQDVLTESGVEESSIYKQKGLNKQHSLELFCFHALGQSYPHPQFEDLAVKFVNACDGLPLSLKVFGGLLAGKNDTSYWEMQLKKLENILPKNIEERLRISYDALDEVEKRIFLDVACFFNGENKDTAITIWNSSHWDGCLGLQNLQNKCLVEVVLEGVSFNAKLKEMELSWASLSAKFKEMWFSRFGLICRPALKIHMHDQLRELGRHIAWSSLPCRLWRWNETAVDNLLQQSSEIIVRGIRMVKSDHLQDDEFEGIQMRRLQLVDTEGSLLERILKRVKSPNLIWLRWKNCPHSCLPPWVPVKNLRVLNVSGYQIETLWQDESQLPVYLEELRVDGCMQLKSIWGLDQLRKLRRFDVSGCSKLEQLPGLQTMASLEELHAMGCRKLKILRGSEKPTRLRYLDVSGCCALEELPNMETMAYLEELHAPVCRKLKILRGGSEKPTMLRHLDVSECSELEDLPNMETMVCLEELNANGCVKLQSIRGLEMASRLRQLEVSGCSELEELPNMETMLYLEELNANSCVKLQSIRGLEMATKLRELNVSGCFELEELPSFQKMVSLEVLSAEECVKLKSLRGLEEATKLSYLDVCGCSELEELPTMETFVSLKELRAERCVKLKSIRGLEQATNLILLDVSWCFDLEELPRMHTLTSLEVLWAKNCNKVKNIRGLEHATKLRSLNVGGCYELHELPSMETLVSLETLWAYACWKLKSLRGLLHCAQLQTLNVSGCCELEEVECIEHCTWLKKPHMSRCPKLQCPVWEWWTSSADD